MPVSYHKEIEQLKDEDGFIEEEIVENGLSIHLLKIMQPTLEPNENAWEKLPKHLNYKLLNPDIFINKLFYYEKIKHSDYN